MARTLFFIILLLFIVFIEIYTYHGLNVNYLATDEISVYLGVDNLTNEKPPALPDLNGGSLLYDAVGRKYYAGVRVSF